MRQAIEEGFIEDVLKSYVTYKTYYKLIKKAKDDPNVERKQAAKGLARFMRLHPHNIGQKTEVMVEHFQHFTRHKIGGHAKAMVVTGSRLEAVRYKQAFDCYIQDKGYPIKSLVAFSGGVEDDKIPSISYTEVEMNGGVKEKELPDTFAKPDFRVLLVAEKYQNEELFSEYMGKPDMQELVSKWLGNQVYDRLSLEKPGPSGDKGPMA